METIMRLRTELKQINEWILGERFLGYNKKKHKYVLKKYRPWH